MVRALVLLSLLLAPLDAYAGPADAALERARAEEAAGRLEAAVAAASEAVAADPSAAALVVRARLRRRVLQAAGPADPAEILADLDQALRADPRSTGAFVLRAQLREFELEDSTGALDDYSAALKLDSRDQEALLGRSRVHESFKHWPEALEDADRAIRAEPFLGRLRRAEVLLEMGDAPGAEAEARLAVDAAAQAGTALTGREAAAVSRRLRAAAADLQSKLSVIETRRLNGQDVEKEAAEARRQLLSTCTVATLFLPGEAFGWVGRGRALEDMGDADGGRRDILLAAERAPEDPESFMARARLAEKDGRKKDADQDWVRAAELQVSRLLARPSAVSAPKP